MPIELNGQPVGDITLNSNTIGEVTVNGTTVYRGIQIIEDFERSNPLNDYQGNVGNWDITTADAIEGQSLIESTGSQGNGELIYSRNRPVSFSRGESVQYQFHNIDGTGTQDMFVFGIQSNAGNNYFVQSISDSFNIGKDVATTGFNRNVLVSSSTGFGGEVGPYTGQVDWTSGGIVFTVFDANGSQIDSVSVSDTEYSSGDIGWWGANGTGTDLPAARIRFDNLIKL